MDKKKVLIVGAGEHMHSHIAKIFGDIEHFEVKRVDILDGSWGINPDIVLLDELLNPPQIDLSKLDFSQLEERCMGLADAVLADGSAVNLKTGRRQSEPELQSIWPRRLGKSVLQQDIYEMLAEQTGRTREEIKDLYFPHAYGTGRLFGGLQQVPRKPEKSRYFSSPYAVNNHGADHPSRKREPKGPRGKWGKL